MLYIFDWDGTLMDSAGKIVSCMQAAASEVGLTHLDHDTVKNIIGLGLPEAIHRLYPGISSDQFDELRSHYVKHFIHKDATPCEFFPGVRETLSSLYEAGHTLAVATGKSRRGLERVWENLDMHNFFHGSRCADETASKPDPQMLHELLEEFEVVADDAVMIGDTEYDMAMAQAVGMPRVAVSYGAHSIERLQAFEPALCLDNFSDLLEYE